jgi:hypothetical protein
MEWFGGYHPTLFAHHVVIVNKADFQSFVYDCIALEAMLEFVTVLFILSNLLFCKREDLLFFATVYEHLVQNACLCLCSGVVFIVAMS